MSDMYECDECGREFKTPQGRGSHRTFAHSDEWDRPWKDTDNLRKEYHENGLSQRDMADKWDTDQATIKEWMKKLDVRSDMARNNPHHPPNHKFHDTGKCVGTEYERIETTVNGEMKVVQIHRLLAYAHRMIDFEDLCDPNINIHHKSGHGLDNRPENLKRMTKSQHQKHHVEERYGDE